MKTFTILLMCFSFAVTSGLKTEAQSGFSASVDFNTFYHQLSPYGQWLDVPRYGRVWSYREPGFRPYATNGQWENTDQGWSWNSDYEWGSIPFHYGRWELDPYYGWIWIPGYEYAPAWVVWSQAGDCYGWAPLGFGLDINVSFGRIPSNRWMYASVGNIGRPRIDRYCIPYERNTYYYGRQQPIVNIYTQRNVRYMGGPRRDDRYGNSRYGQGRFGNRQQPYDNRDRSYGNRDRNGDNDRPRNNDYPDNGRPWPRNEIHYDPSTYDRNSAIGSRPPVTRDTRGFNRETRPEIRRIEPAPQMNQGQRPQIDRSSRQQMPQPRMNSEAQRQPQRSEGARPMSRERRIF